MRFFQFIFLPKQSANKNKGCVPNAQKCAKGNVPKEQGGRKMNREEAFEILNKYMKGEKYLKHSLAVEAIMKGLAKKLEPEKEEYWGIVGLLHDLDEEHCNWQEHP